MAVLPHHIAGGLLLGGITIGGYFAVNGLTPPKLNDHLSSLGLEVLSSGWETKETDYKAASGVDLISSITKEPGQEGKITDFADKLQKWCTKYKQKPFLGEDDDNFKRFSLWCTKKEKIQQILERRGLKALTKEEKETKLLIYNSEGNTDKFLDPTPAQRAPAPKTTVPPQKSATLAKTITDLDDWCTKTQKDTDYKYESDFTVKKVIEWCYKK